MIAGIDEAGRGPWAGPLVVGAVVLGDSKIEGLTDSKKLSKSKRERLSAEIIDKVASFGIGWVEASEIDTVGLSQSLKLATRRAVEQLSTPYHEIIIDGTVNFLEGTNKESYVTTLKKADLLIASVSAASIVAKVARDDYMTLQSELYPAYGFESHMGYGTAVHRAAIYAHGITDIHRKSFAPIAKLINGNIQPRVSIQGTNKDTGNKAESLASTWLETCGYKIIERNWNTRFCEVDIIAVKHETIYFMEVKHRASADQGGGLAAITPPKLRQMKFAAAVYLQKLRVKPNAQLGVVITLGVAENVYVDDLLLIE